MTTRPASPAATSDSRSDRDVTHSARRWWALVAIAASVLVVGLDLTVLNLALPSMSVDLHASTGDLQWIVDAYSLVLAALILPAGLLGIGAAAIFPLALSVLPVLFDGPDRQRAVAAIGGASMLSFPIGPIVGGYLLDHFWWGSVFLINVPVVVIALVAVTALLPESWSAARPSIDVAGLLVSSAGLVALTYGFIKAGQDGWSDVTAVTLIATGVVALALLPPVERRVARRGGHPLADLRLFRSADFRWGTILATLMSFAMFGMFFALPQYFQDVRGADALGSSTGYTLAWVAVAGLGLGLVMPAAMGIALGALSAERSGAGSALLTAMRQVGSTIGVAVLGTVISNSYVSRVAAAAAALPAQAAAAVRSSVGSGVAVAGQLGSSSLLDTVRSASVHGMDLMLWTCGGIAVGCALLAVIFLRARQGNGDAADTASSEAGSLSVM